MGDYMNADVFRGKSYRLRGTVKSHWGKLTDAKMRGIEDEDGAIGYIVLWLMGVPAGLLFFIFLLRGCN
jgi:hypothetical protein